MSYKGLVIGFARSGVLGFGGGPSTIPLIRYEAVEKFRLIDDEQFGEILALANALPGPIATKMAAYIGYKVKGIWGAVVAILSHILPSIVVLLSLVGSLYALRGSPVVDGMIQGIGPMIGVMLGVMTYEFVQKSWKGFGARRGTGLLLLSVFILVPLQLHPAIAIAAFLAIAFGFSTYRSRREKGQPGKVEKEAAAAGEESSPVQKSPSSELPSAEEESGIAAERESLAEPEEEQQERAKKRVVRGEGGE